MVKEQIDVKRGVHSPRATPGFIRSQSPRAKFARNGMVGAGVGQIPDQTGISSRHQLASDGDEAALIRQITRPGTNQPQHTTHKVGKYIKPYSMELCPNLQEIAYQSDPDIRKYKLIFDRHSILCGKPQNLAAFLQELKENRNFAADFWQQTAFVQTREKGNLAQCELLTLLVISVAGPDVSTVDDQICRLVMEFNALILAHKNSPIPATVPKLRNPADPSQSSDRKSLEDWRGKKFTIPITAAKFSAKSRQYFYLAGVGILSLLAIASLRSIAAGVHHSERKRLSEVTSINEKVANQSKYRWNIQNVDAIESAPTSLPIRSRSQAALPLPLPTARKKNRGSRKDFSHVRGLEPNPAAHSDHFAQWEGSSKANRTRSDPRRRNIRLATTSTPLLSSSGEKAHSIDVSSGIMTGNLLQCHLPSYPRLASLTHVQGHVFLQTVVSTNGTVESVQVIKGPYLLRRAAARAVRTWRYKPYVINGKPSEIATIVTVDFALRD